MEWSYNLRVVRKVFVGMRFDQVSERRVGGWEPLEWMDVPGRGQSKCGRTRELAWCVQEIAKGSEKLSGSGRWEETYELD